MTRDKLLIGIRTATQFKKEVLIAAKAIDAGLPPQQPVCRLYFPNQKHLFRILSPKRMELLKFLRKNGPLSIRKLSSNLKRDYKNVYEDVKQLLKLSLIKKKRDQKLYVPWDDITIEVALAA